MAPFLAVASTSAPVCAAPHVGACSGRTSWPRPHAWRGPAPHGSSLYGTNAPSKRAAGPRAVKASAAAAPPPAAAGGGGMGRVLLKFLAANYIPAGLLAAIVVGWTNPALGLEAAQRRLQPVATVGIFVISGLVLEQSEALAAVRSRAALAYGLLAILGLTPALAPAALALPLQPPALALGLAVFLCMPTTLSACVALTQAAGGNSAMALLLTVSSNLLAVFTLPLLLTTLLGSAAGPTQLEPVALFKSLVLTVLVPLLSGMVLQAVVPGLRAWRSANRRLLSYASTAFLCLVPWMEVSKASAARLPLSAVGLAATVAAALGLHLVLLAGNSAAASALRFDPDADQDAGIRTAVVLATSQKTLPIAIAVLAQLSGAIGPAAGFAVVACVLAHLTQTVFDSLLVSFWNARKAGKAA